MTGKIFAITLDRYIRQIVFLFSSVSMSHLVFVLNSVKVIYILLSKMWGMYIRVHTLIYILSILINM